MERPHLSDDIRGRAVAAVEVGQSVRDVATFCQNDPSTVRRWVRRACQTGSVTTRRRSGQPPVIRPEQENALRTRVAAHPDATLAQHCARWEAAQGVCPSLTTMSRMLRILGLPLKKTLIAHERDAAARSAWRKQMAAVSPEHRVFLDETGTPIGLTPRQGRALRGQRVVGRVPRGRWTNVTLLASLSADGMGPARQFTGALGRASFETYIETMLVPALHPGPFVVLDNRSVHKRAGARQLIEAAGCPLVFLPTYSPDLNPVEAIFAKLKQLLRRAETRTIDAVITAPQHLFPHITAQDAREFFRAAGYNLRQPL